MEYDYDISDNITVIRDSRGRKVVQYEYFLDHSIKKVTLPDDSTRQSAYDLYGNIQKLTDGKGNSVQFEYDVLQQMADTLRELDGVEKSTEYEYNKNGDLVKVTDARGNSTEFLYDKAGNVRQVNYPDGTSERSVFDAAGNLIEHYDGKDRKTAFQYDENDRLYLITLHDSSTVRYYFDKNGNVTERDDHFADTAHKDTVTLYQYDSNNRPIRVVCRDSSGKTLYQHKTAYDFTNLTTGFADIFGPQYGSGVKYAGANIIGETEGAYYDHIYKYSPADGSGVMPLKYGSGDAQGLLYGEDVIGEPGEITGESDISGRVKYGMGTKSSYFSYDNLSRITENTDLFGNKYYYGYDQYSRLAMVRYPNNIFTGYAFDEAGRLSEIRHERMETDGTRTLLESFSYNYDLNGNITRITRADTSCIDYTYDEWNRLTQERWSSLGLELETAYEIGYSFTTTGEDKFGDTGNICSKSVTGPWAVWWDTAWNGKTRVKITNSGDETLANYQVKIELDTTNLTLKSDGSDIRVLNEIQETELPFWLNPDTATAVTKEIWVKMSSLPVGDTYIYIYYGNNSASSTSDGDDVFDAFDDFNNGDYSDKWTVVTGTWSESGGVLSQTASSTPANIKFNDNISLIDYILEVKAKKTGGNEGFLITFRAGSYLPWWNLGGWGNSRSVVESIDGTMVNPDSVTTDTWYNIQIKVIYSENRYIGAIGTGTPVEQWDTVDTIIGQSGNQNADKISLATWATQVEYDNWRIRKYAAVEPAATVVRHYGKPATTLPLVEPAALTTTFEYDDYNKLTEINFPDSTTETLSYDDNGQLVKSEKSTGETTNYEWNDQGMLVKVILPTGEPVEYEYDGNQRLISRKSSDGVDNFVQSGWDIMTKMDDVGKRTYYTGSSAVVDEDNQTYFHYNHRGDTVLVTDSEGNTLNNFSYEAYGKPTNSEGIPINPLILKNATAPTSGNNNLPNLFVGASGIRYDTKTNLHYMRFRWFSEEQMRFISADLLMDLNRYAYVEGNPITRIDPAGLEWWGGGHDLPKANLPRVLILYAPDRWINIEHAEYADINYLQIFIDNLFYSHYWPSFGYNRKAIEKLRFKFYIDEDMLRDTDQIINALPHYKYIIIASHGMVRNGICKGIWTGKKYNIDMIDFTEQLKKHDKYSTYIIGEFCYSGILGEEAKENLKEVHKINYIGSNVFGYFYGPAFYPPPLNLISAIEQNKNSNINYILKKFPPFVQASKKEDARIRSWIKITPYVPRIKRIYRD